MNIVGCYDEEKIEESIEYTKKMMPQNGTLLLLSLTGSRAFGWGGDVYDYDIHGIFYAEQFWGWCHDAKKYDLNMYNLKEKVVREISRAHFSFFINISNPYYIHEDFDYEGLMDYTTDIMVKDHPKNEFNRFQHRSNVRSSLHCYREILQSIHYLEKGEIVTNINELTEIYNVKFFEEMANLYKNRVNHYDELDKVEEELKKLLDKFNKYKIEDGRGREFYRQRRKEAKQWVGDVINDIS